ncbi:CBS domain-containing protein [Nitrosopumilus maritimus]|uniref:Signal transduction protein with CBS domains n=1 Tax=Nitrosopumilus maritimus (strain SCM1) TaxID=436308 RepID=A9A1I8_NITMS|nr:CBS domain-containing protein [Nitrosopumilus maritimus]ABX13167.1 putative signal transduction protein with CBS domains [Nitrosopumilus maritimus SCM1]
MSELVSISQKPITSDSNESLDKIITKMLKDNISRIVLTQGNSPVGIITEKDIGLFLLTDDTERNLADIPASQIMNNFTSVNESMSVEKCVELMLEQNIGSLGVSSSQNELVGIITKTDIAKYYSQNYVGKHTVGDIMTISYIAANSDDYLKDVVQKMVEEKISRIFLKNKENDPEGILTFRDLFHVALEKGNTDAVLDNADDAISVVFTRKGFLSDSGFGATTMAKDVMTKSFETIDFEEELTVACKVMAQNKINGLGVKINGKLGGVLSKTDTLKAIYVDNHSK